jgi:LmbE family N-acetylglucosaminyl deacetylase
MAQALRLLCVLAHPDDESLGFGGTLARYGAEGVETRVVTATRGQAGWSAPGPRPPPEEIGRIREAELRAAAGALGVARVDLLDYGDGQLDQADAAEATAALARHVRAARPQVVATFGPDGAYGHPDHVAISQLTTAAVARAADPGYRPADGLAAHAVAKLYYRAFGPAELARYEAVFGRLAMDVDGVERGSLAWPDWATTTWIDAAAHWRAVARAVDCHRSQLPADGALARLTEAGHRALWGCQGYYRAMSLVNGGRAAEADLFEGLR